MKNIMSCLLALGPFVVVAGALFLYDSSQGRLTQDEAITIRWLACFCGPDFYEKVTIVSSMWDQLAFKELKKKRALFEELQVGSDLAQVLSPPGRYRGGQVYHHAITVNPPGTWLKVLDHEDDIPARAAMAKAMIQARYADAAAVTLQVRHELDAGTRLADTSAARAVRPGGAPIAATKLRVKHGKAVIPGADEPDPDPEIAAQPAATHLGRMLEWAETREGGTFWEWLNVAKGMALYFFRLQVKEAASVVGWLSKCRDRVWNWWSGSPPDV